jgi:hypothetical protein
VAAEAADYVCGIRLGGWRPDQSGGCGQILATGLPLLKCIIAIDDYSVKILATIVSHRPY